MDKTYDYECPNCGFKSTGWPLKKDKDARAKQHQAEHDTREPMIELAEFQGA